MPEVVYPTMVAWPVAVHSVRRGLSYYNAQCFFNYSLHGGNCSRRHTAVQGFWLIWKKFSLNWESATPLYLEFHVCRLDYPLVAMPSSGCAGTVEQSLAHYWDSHADSSHPLVSVGVAVSDFDARCWVMQHTLP